MSDATPPIVDVLIDERGPDAGSAELRQYLDLLGLAPRARIRTMPAERGVEAVHWTMLLVVVLTAFLAAIGTRLGNDAYHGLTRVIRQAMDRRPAEEDTRCLIVARDRDSGIEIILEPDLPAEALRQLSKLTEPARGPVRWDRRARRWRSPTDRQRDA